MSPPCRMIHVVLWSALWSLLWVVILLTVYRRSGCPSNRWISTIAGRRWFQDLRARVKEVLEAVETAEGLADITFEGKGAPPELDRELADVLRVPDREVDWRTGLGIEYLGKSAGDRFALELALELAGSEEAVRELVEDGYDVLPFYVRLEGPIGTVSTRGVVVPLGRSDGTPVVAVVGVGRRGTGRIEPVDSKLFVFGGLVSSRRTFSSVLRTFGELLPGDHADRRGARHCPRPPGGGGRTGTRIMTVSSRR
ncbi:hypothetical protein [Methanopyrus kandleri]